MIVNTPVAPAEMRQKLGRDTGRVITVDATRIAIEEIGSGITNMPLLGAFAAATNIFSVKELEVQVRSRFGKKLSPELVDANVRAIKRAASEAKDA